VRARVLQGGPAGKPKQPPHPNPLPLMRERESAGRPVLLSMPLNKSARAMRASTLASSRAGPSLMSSRFHKPSSPGRKTSTRKVWGSISPYSLSDASWR